jgi:hypothetical protein
MLAPSFHQIPHLCVVLQYPPSVPPIAPIFLSSCSLTRLPFCQCRYEHHPKRTSGAHGRDRCACILLPPSALIRLISFTGAFVHTSVAVSSRTHSPLQPAPYSEILGIRLSALKSCPRIPLSEPALTMLSSSALEPRPQILASYPALTSCAHDPLSNLAFTSNPAPTSRYHIPPLHSAHTFRTQMLPHTHIPLSHSSLTSTRIPPSRPRARRHGMPALESRSYIPSKSSHIPLLHPALTPRSHILYPHASPRQARKARRATPGLGSRTRRHLCLPPAPLPAAGLSARRRHLCPSTSMPAAELLSASCAAQARSVD